MVQLLPEFAVPGATAIRRSRPLPAQRLPWVLAAGLVALALFGLVLVALRASA
ncbi:hypothetical protein GCM10023200_59530 [Actinomycetospora chlora]|uniref:Uncharacterized protein n=1 Tax=Actinomycetospora chlora TaxID=663608 RepID=A0ABP9CT64_9PSEU